RKKRVPIIPVDSEHSAIFQCLTGESMSQIEKIVLTASGGPFRGWKESEIRDVTVRQALNHPNWCMGQKISIDSATMMNKGLEVIEAKWLFNLNPGQIEVVVHPESIIHSMVQFIDGSMKAQMGLPDMRLPIHYAFAFPKRIQTNFDRFSFTDYPILHFETPDYKIFRNLAISFETMKKGGNYPCIMNAANEVAVGAFLEERIGFTEMPGIIEETLAKAGFMADPGLEDLVDTDHAARRIAKQLI
ncbi:MAG TPA: 1-deoxy-D-xylulose-5-phosphate reductoisomerase, partial [Bacteroidales bacterium]|nr:1-deoxy-D-xylulose-5-phosphate reductoisomerase [Bacteroidales bacterium]